MDPGQGYSSGGGRQAFLALAIFRATAAQARTSEKIYELQNAMEEARARVELVPVIVISSGHQTDSLLLSIANSTSNGCRVCAAQLFMERVTTNKDDEWRLDRPCVITGSGVIPPFGDLNVDVATPMRTIYNALWPGPKT